MILAASSIVSSGPIVTGFGVIHWRTRASAARAREATARSRSRSVTMPTIRTMSSTTTTAPTFAAFIFSAASPIVSDGSTVSTSFTMRSATVAMGHYRRSRESRLSLRTRPPVWQRRAVVDRVLLEVDARDRRLAHVARFAEPVVDAVRPLVARPLLAQREAAGELLVDRGCEASDLLVVEVGGQRVGRELRRVQDLVRPRAADPGERALVAQQRVQPVRLAAEDLGERRRADAERIGAEVRDLGLRGFRRE